MQLQRHLNTAHCGLKLLLLFALVLLASPSRAHDVHEHAETQDPATAADTRTDIQETPRSLLQAFRATGDDAYLDGAWSLVNPQLQRRESNPELLIEAALIAQARHQFDRALELTRSALEIDRRNDQAWLLLASIHLVTGEIELARNACDELTRAPIVVMLGCDARVAHASRDGVKVMSAFKRLLSITEATQVGTGTIAWALSVAGDLAVASNDADGAVEYFTRSLSLNESAQVRSALVDVLLANGRLTQAQATLDSGSGALPLDVRRLILAKRQDRIAEVNDRVAAFDRQFQEWIAAEDWLHAREMVRFYLDVLERPALARRLAEINIATQQEYEDQLLLRRTT